MFSVFLVFMLRLQCLKFESQAAHAGEMVLYQLLAFVIGFRRKCIEETVVSSGFSLGTRAAWFQTLRIQRIDFGIRRVVRGRRGG